MSCPTEAISLNPHLSIHKRMLVGYKNTHQTNTYLSITNITRDILIDTGMIGVVLITTKSGYTGLIGTYFPSIGVAIYHVDGALKSMNYIHDKLILREI